MDYQEPAPGTYRLGQGIHVVGEQAICTYPLRVMHVSTTGARLLELCKEERTAEKLAHMLSMPVRRIELLCERLRWKGLLEAGPKREPATWPGVSIVIPSYNRARQLERCLCALLELDYPAASLEIIVVDDASTDGTGALLERLSGAFAGQRVMRTIRHQRQRGAAQARNTGAEAARLELLGYIDSDCVPSKGWLKELVPAFGDMGIGIVGGMIRAYGSQRILARYEDVRSSLFLGVRSQQVKLAGPLTYVPTANMLVRKNAWERVGGFAPLTFGEDVDFCHRVFMAGAKGLYEPRGIVYHDYRTRWWAFLKIRAAYASAEAVLQKQSAKEIAPSIAGTRLIASAPAAGSPTANVIKRVPPKNLAKGRRILVLPVEQGLFAGLVVGGLWRWMVSRSTASFLWYCIAMSAFILLGAGRRFTKVKRRGVPLVWQEVYVGTTRGYLAYVYHLSRHITRYYTLPLLGLGLVMPPLLLLLVILCGIVMSVDYARLRPKLGPGAYALCAFLDDCAYEVGVCIGCVKERTWKPLVPIVRRRVE